jgi:hypothetical protein
MSSGPILGPPEEETDREIARRQRRVYTRTLTRPQGVREREVGPDETPRTREESFGKAVVACTRAEDGLLLSRLDRLIEKLKR